MSLAKYNARDVAKDFGVKAKVITDILAEHTKETVSPTKTLSDRELTLIFEYLTQHNQVDSIESPRRRTRALRASRPSPSTPPETKPRLRALGPSSRPPASPSRVLLRPAECPRRRWWTPARAAR